MAEFCRPSQKLEMQEGSAIWEVALNGTYFTGPGLAVWLRTDPYSVVQSPQHEVHLRAHVDNLLYWDARWT